MSTQHTLPHPRPVLLPASVLKDGWWLVETRSPPAAVFVLPTGEDRRRRLARLRRARGLA